MRKCRAALYLEACRLFPGYLPVWRCQSDQYDAFQPDVPEAGEQYPALRWPDREAAVPDEYYRGDVSCAFCGAYRRDPGAADFHGSLWVSQQEILCRRSRPIPVPVPANGAVPPCAVWHGGSPVSLDGAQAEKAIPGRTDTGIKLNLTW